MYLINSYQFCFTHTQVLDEYFEHNLKIINILKNEQYGNFNSIKFYLYTYLFGRTNNLSRC